jgi:hypothetical protein
LPSASVLAARFVAFSGGEVIWPVISIGSRACNSKWGPYVRPRNNGRVGVRGLGQWSWVLVALLLFVKLGA